MLEAIRSSAAAAPQQAFAILRLVASLELGCWRLMLRVPGCFRTFLHLKEFLAAEKTGLSKFCACGKSPVMPTAQHSHYRRRSRKGRWQVIGFGLLVLLVIGLVVGLLLLINSPALDMSR